MRRKSGRGSGGQTGHPGKNLRQTGNPDEVVDHLPDACPDCGHPLSPEDSAGYATRRAFDLPPPRPLRVTEHRRHACRCPGCGAKVCAEFPDAVDAKVCAEIGGGRFDACCDEAIAFREVRPLPAPRGRRRGRKRRRKGHDLAIRLRKRREEVLLFMRKTVVPFTNGEAERGCA